VPAADLLAVRVERDDVPAAQLIRVPARAGAPGLRAEVGEVAGRAGRPVLVVAGRRADARLEAPPRGVERVLEVGERAGRVLQVAERRDDVRPLALDEARRVRLPAGEARAPLAGRAGDVAGGDERRAADGRRGRGAGPRRGRV